MEWLRATYPLTIIHFGNVSVRVILTPRELFFLCVCVCLPPKTWFRCHGLDSCSLDWSERERTSTNWILNGEETCSPLSQNVRWPLIDLLLSKLKRQTRFFFLPSPVFSWFTLQVGQRFPDCKMPPRIERQSFRTITSGASPGSNAGVVVIANSPVPNHVHFMVIWFWVGWMKWGYCWGGWFGNWSSLMYCFDLAR